MFVIYYWCKSINGWRDEDFQGSRWQAIAYAIKVQLSRLAPVYVEDEFGNRVWG